jgi:hypothetical protein
MWFSSTDFAPEHERPDSVESVIGTFILFYEGFEMGPYIWQWNMSFI